MDPQKLTKNDIDKKVEIDESSVDKDEDFIEDNEVRERDFDFDSIYGDHDVGRGRDGEGRNFNIITQSNK